MKEYHVLALSGGKDSAALAFFIKDNMPEIHEKIEYIFCDTEHEIPETYTYLDKIEIFLDKQITRLKPYKSFDHLYELHKYLPSVNMRWCTIEMKTKVIRKYMHDKIKNDKDSVVNLYIGIRGDELQRTEHKQYVKFIKELYPFADAGLTRQDIIDILEKNGIGLPDYYKWRKRSGCYFCFYQSKMDWVNLYENHPDLYEKAMNYEFTDCEIIKGKRFGWNIDMPLKDIIKPENIKKIKEDYQKLQEKKAQIADKNKSNTFFDNLDEPETKCIMCHL